jgi:transcriptional regulator with XRE-family HTH domain
MSGGEALPVTMAVMDGRVVGRVLRAVRMQLRLTQREVAELAHVSQTRVSDAELGRLEHFSLRTLDEICAALGVSLRLEAWWRGTDSRRLLDRSHASIVEVVARELTARGWTVIPEYTFNHFGERGSVDLVAWMPLARSLLIIEVKSEIVDLQDLFATLGRKTRIVPSLLRPERGWSAATVSKVVALPDTTANRSIIARHGAIFAASLPSHTREIRAWLREPYVAISGVWLISPTRVAAIKKAIRVRKARHKADGTQVEREKDRHLDRGAPANGREVRSARHEGN